MVTHSRRGLKSGPDAARGFNAGERGDECIPTCRWLISDRLCVCRNSIGSLDRHDVHGAASPVSRCRWADASVVDFPEPVGPVMSTVRAAGSPVFNWGGSPSNVEGSTTSYDSHNAWTQPERDSYVALPRKGTFTRKRPTLPKSRRVKGGVESGPLVPNSPALLGESRYTI